MRALPLFVHRNTHCVRDEQMHLPGVLHYILLQSRRDELAVDLRCVDLTIRFSVLGAIFVHTITEHT